MKKVGTRLRISFVKAAVSIGSCSLTLLLVSLVMLALHAPVNAKVTGQCANCHTMHNSQDGLAVNAGGPNEYLLKGGADSCVGCHSAEGNETIINLGGSSVPIVNNAGEPTYPPNGSSTSALAGGNYYWVINRGDAYGHNCLSVPGIAGDSALAGGAPGQPSEASGPNCAGCHQRIDGCKSCHKPAHHADDSDTLVGESGGWYRFLKSSQHGGPTTGVKGIEDADWEQSVAAADHNEHLGCDNPTSNSDNSMSDYCAGCHHRFHGINNTDSPNGEPPDNESPWYLHPTHLPLPASIDKDYRLYNTPDGENIGPYNPEAPVARDPVDITGMAGASSVVTPGKDQVFCLSCHRVHGSPYADILRWDYAKMLTTNPAPEDKGHGCFVCHVTKDE